MKSTKFLIIGAGISGASFANAVKDDYLIIEKSNRIGGLCKSFRQGDFVWDCGGHFFHTQNEDALKNIINPNQTIRVAKNAKIYIDKRYIDFPFQNNISQLSPRWYARCLNGLKAKKPQKANNLLGDLYGKFGKPIVQKFLRPYNEKLYCTSLKNLSKTSMGRFFPKFSLDALNKPVQYNSYFFYNRGGIEALLSPVFEKLDMSRVILNCHYTELDKEKKILKTNKGNIKFEFLINTSPFNEFFAVADPEGFAKSQALLQSNKVLLFNFGFDRPAKNPFHWIYYPEKKFAFYRVGQYNNIVGSKNLSIYVEIGLKPHQEVNIQKCQERVLKNLKKAGIVDGHILLQSNHMVISPAYIHINEKSDQIVNEQLASWQKDQIFSVGRYGLWKYSCMEDDILAAQNLAKKLKEF